jgi:hypothetical protein
VSAKLTDTLTANLSGAYRQAYINAPAQTPGLHIATGTKINDVPQHRRRLSLNYERMIVDDYRGIARINGAYVGPMHDVSYYHETLSPYALRDARAAADLNPLYVQPAADHWSSVPDEALKLAQQIINQWRTKPPDQTKPRCQVDGSSISITGSDMLFDI